jgi:5,10-methylenetetrahydrofolate reductase
MFSIAKFRKRFKKYWNKLYNFIKIYQEWSEKPGSMDLTSPNLTKFRLFMVNLHACNIALSKLEGNPDEQKQWDELIKRMNAAKFLATQVLESRTDCETWASKVSTGNGTLPLSLTN